MDIKTREIFPWKSVIILSDGDSHPRWKSAMNDVFEIIVENAPYFSILWSNALTRLQIQNTKNYPLMDHLGNMFELFQKIPLFVGARHKKFDCHEERNLFVLKCLASAMLTNIRVYILEDDTEFRREQNAFREKLSLCEGDEKSKTLEQKQSNKPPRILYLVSELLTEDVPELRRSEHAGFAIFYPRLNRYEEFVAMSEKILKGLWSKNWKGGRDRIIQAHEQHQKLIDRRRGFHDAVEKQTMYIKKLEEKIKRALNEEEKLKKVALLEDRYAFRERLRKQEDQEASDFTLGSTMMPLSQKLLAWIFDPEGKISSDSWGRYGNRFKRDLMAKVSTVKEKRHESIN